MIHIVTDSTAQLTDREIRTNHITVIPLTVTLNGKNYRDQIGLKSIFETDFKRHSEPRLPSTAQINH